MTPQTGDRRHIQRKGFLSRLESSRAGRPEAVWSDSKTEGNPNQSEPPQKEGERTGRSTRQARREVVTSYHIRKSPQLQALFHSLCRVLCTIRSLYLCTIGSASHIQAGQASSCRFHAALSSNTTQRSGAGGWEREPLSDQQTGTGLSPCITLHHSR